MTPKPSSDGSRAALAAFSQKAVRKAVLGRILQSPAFLYPTAVGMLSAMAMGVFDISALLVGAASVGMGAGLAGLGYLFAFRRDQISRDYLVQMHETVNARRERLMRQLMVQMEEVGFSAGLTQLQQLRRKFDNFVAILDQTLAPEEITYGRYRGIAEQVYLSGVDNLDRAAGALASVRTIDPQRIDERLGEIHADGLVTAAEEHELQALQERRGLFVRERERVDMLLAANEKAMTQLDLTAAAIADIRTSSGQASMDMESAMAELQALVQQAPAFRRQV